MKTVTIPLIIYQELVETKAKYECLVERILGKEFGIEQNKKESLFHILSNKYLLDDYEYFGKLASAAIIKDDVAFEEVDSLI